MACAICQVRRPKRSCPGVRGEICSICCGQEREVSIACPLDCEHLQDARRHDKPVPLDAASVPHPEIQVTERFVAENEELVIFLGQKLSRTAIDISGVADFDVRAALDALIRTFLTLQSGVYYETRPDNALANRIYSAVQESIAEYRRLEQERTGLPKTRDADVLGILVFFARLELDRNNGRPKGRAFIGLLSGFYAAPPGEPDNASSLVLP
jgi:hypothetical protein